MANAYSCNVNGLLKAARCFTDKCMAQPDRDALMIYARIKNLAAVGGTNYSTNLKQLMIDSATWRKRAEDQLKAISVYIALQNAIQDGASINLNVNSLMTAAKCLRVQCLGNEDMAGILAYLQCALNTVDRPS